MLIVISPAKTLDYDTPPATAEYTQPRFLDRSQELVDNPQIIHDHLSV